MSVTPASTDSVSINMLLAREGAAIAAGIARRERLQYFEDLIADALYDHETGVVSHRRQAEAVLASLLNAGIIR
jgi:predicted alpha-1,6-mannanase (GH76 family)